MKLKLGIVCHGCIAPEYFALWTREATGHLSLVARYDEVGPISMKTFVETPICVTTPTSMKPAQERFHVNERINLFKYRTGTIYTQKHAVRFDHISGSANCRLCGNMDSINHIVLGCSHPTCQGMFVNRHNTALSLCREALSKGAHGSFLVAMDACCREKLQEQGIKVTENISRDIPDWASFNGTGPFARHQSRPNAISVRPIQGRATHLNPRMIPAHDRYSPCGT
eukprot:64195-Pelagomonas_calceolata.AAC.1